MKSYFKIFSLTKWVKVAHGAVFNHPNVQSCRAVIIHSKVIQSWRFYKSYFLEELISQVCQMVKKAVFSMDSSWRLPVITYQLIYL